MTTPVVLQVRSCDLNVLHPFYHFGAVSMGTKSQGNPDQPPSPGGDPDQPDNNVPVPPARNNEVKNKDKSGYGHPGNREEIPVPEGAPKPHQIF